ncbi:MAG: hypothetical protein K2I54_02865, partial [Muribaculaceae bacterium]|nr:hypothetical protein [Muribaculaceae bacterium]
MPDDDSRRLSPEEIEQLLAEADRLCELGLYDAAFALDLRAAEGGDARARTHLGWYYENGLGTTRDTDKAFYWYSLAAGQDYAEAQYILTQFYDHDSDEYRRLLRAAAINGSPAAMTDYGLDLSDTNPS